MSKKSKKLLAKAEEKLAKAVKAQAKAKKMKDEAIRMQLAMMQAPDTTAQLPYDTINALAIRPETSYSGQPAQMPVQTPSLALPTGPDAPPDQAPMQRDASRITQHFRRNRVPYAVIAAVLLISVIGLVYASITHDPPAPEAAAAVSRDQSDPAPAPQAAAAPGLPERVVVLDKWEMPDELYEISSNAFIDADRVACIQDADGIIYTYNLKKRQIENRLKFAKPGDFEALSVVGNAFYALRSDGLLFEVHPSGSGAPAVKQYQLPLRGENETEPMFYDQPNNRLLVGVKEQDPQSDTYKGVYSFDLTTKTMQLKPVMTIPATHDIHRDESTAKKKKSRPIKPSEIAIDPRSGDLYVLNGPHAEFLIVGKDGALKQAIQLDKSIFPQPEGMCFSPSGELYISSEGGKHGVGVLAKVALR